MQSSTLSVFLYKKSAITKCTPTKFIQTNRHAVTLNSRSTNKQVTMSYHTVFPELHSSSLSPKNTTGLNLNHLQSHIMVHAHTLFFGVSSIFFSDFDLPTDGCTTACMVITPLGSSPKGVLH